MGRAWVFHRSLGFSSAEGQLSQVLALNGCPKEADDSCRLEPDGAKPEGSVSHRFPRAGLDGRPYAHRSIPAVWCHVHQVSSIGEGKGGFHRSAWKGLLSPLHFPFATLAILPIFSLYSHSPFLLSIFFLPYSLSSFHLYHFPFSFSFSPHTVPPVLSLCIFFDPPFLPAHPFSHALDILYLMFSVPSSAHITSSITPKLSYSPHPFANKRFWFSTAASRMEQNGT